MPALISGQPLIAGISNENSDSCKCCKSWSRPSTVIWPASLIAVHCIAGLFVDVARLADLTHCFLSLKHCDFPGLVNLLNVYVSATDTHGLGPYRLESIRNGPKACFIRPPVAAKARTGP